MTAQPTDTRAALDAAIDANTAAAIADAGALGAPETRTAAVAAAGALDRAIAAHVEAEVARRLAAAPDVEAAIDRLDTYADPFRADALRAAIVADKARAVADARRVGFKAGSAERSSVHDAISVSPQDAARAAMDHGAPCPTCGSEGRLTPDEAEALVERFEGLAQWQSPGYDAARTALLRALGVEA